MRGARGFASGVMASFFRRVWFGRSRRSTWFKRIGTAIFALLVPLPILYLLICRFVPVPGTPQMVLYVVTGRDVRYEWKDYDEISPALKRSVIASEDQKFCSHHGFDWDSIEETIQDHDGVEHKRLRGASTLSQQVARTLFLLPVRSWVRKGLEAYYTVLLEALWPKQRIYHAYLNLVDWGNGNFGAEAASEDYFRHPARALTKTEASRLATILPNPDKWSAERPGRYVAKRSKVIRSRAGDVRRDNLDWCVRQPN